MLATTTHLRPILVFVLAVALGGGTGGCRTPSAPLHLRSIEIGTAVDAQQRVVSPVDLDFAFSTDSTIYASIGTEGSGSGTLHLLWGDLISGYVHTEQEQRVSADGPAFFAFHFKPEGGWSSGRHMIIFALDGDKHSREFTVR